MLEPSVKVCISVSGFEVKEHFLRGFLFTAKLAVGCTFLLSLCLLNNAPSVVIMSNCNSKFSSASSD